MCSPTVGRRWRKVAVEPVKWIPARSGWTSAASETACPLPVTMLTTPGGRPAASSSCMRKCAENCWVGLGFQTTVQPISAGAVGRLPAIEVKLNGVIARTKPSSGRWSSRFHVAGGLTGGRSARIWRGEGAENPARRWDDGRRRPAGAGGGGATAGALAVVGGGFQGVAERGGGRGGRAAGVLPPPPAPPLTADHQRQVDRIGAELLEPRFE